MASVKRKKDADDAQEDGALAFEVTSPVNLPQLAEEFRTEFEDEPRMSTEGITQAASTEEPVTLWVAGIDAKISQVQSVISGHEPNPGWVNPRLADPARTLDELADRAEDGSMSDADALLAVRLLLRERKR